MTPERSKTPLLQRFFEYIWYSRTPLRFIFLPLSALFCQLGRRRRKRQTARQLHFDIPVIVVGNINVGGSGKTPLVLYLVKLLRQHGYRPAIISRGYKSRIRSDCLLVNQQTPVELCGDEASLMASKSGVPVIIGADRLRDIQYVLKHTDCTIILSDDGMQHYRMKRDIEIAVVDGQRQFGNGLCLPAGPLREKPSRLRECDFVIVNGRSNPALPGIKVINMAIVPDNLFINVSTGEKRGSDSFNTVRVVTAIGNPRRFVQTLEQLNLAISMITTFPDHHYFTASEFIANDKNPVVMTEKDAVKCHGLGLENCWYLPVRASLDNDFAERFIGRVNAINTKLELSAK